VTGALVLFSGGKDSTVALTWAVSQHERVVAASFAVPYRPRREAAAASAVADALNVPLETVPMPFLHDVGSLVTSRVARQTATAYVPVRNLVFHAVACHLAQVWSLDVVVAGHITSDATAYADASADYLQAIYLLAASGSDNDYLNDLHEAANPVRLILPLMGLTDERVVALGARLGAPLDLSWSCLEDRPSPCGVCVSCRDREAALAGLGRTPCSGG